MPTTEKIEVLRNQLVAIPGFIDQQNVVHHILKSGRHGLKMEFGVVQKGMPEYDSWVELNALAIQERHTDANEIYIVGVANGTIGFSFDVAEAVGKRANRLTTKKYPDKSVHLSAAAKIALNHEIRTKPPVAVVVEDVGTTGLTAGLVALECRDLGAEAEVQNTWQRSRTLEFLVKNNIAHYALIHEVIPSLSQEMCEERGDCSRGVKLEPHG